MNDENNPKRHSSVGYFQINLTCEYYWKDNYSEGCTMYAIPQTVTVRGAPHGVSAPLTRSLAGSLTCGQSRLHESTALLNSYLERNMS